MTPAGIKPIKRSSHVPISFRRDRHVRFAGLRIAAPPHNDPRAATEVIVALLLLTAFAVVAVLLDEGRHRDKHHD